MTVRRFFAAWWLLGGACGCLRMTLMGHFEGGRVPPRRGPGPVSVDRWPGEARGSPAPAPWCVLPQSSSGRARCPCRCRPARPGRAVAPPLQPVWSVHLLGRPVRRAELLAPVVPVGQPVPSPRAGTAAVSASPTCSCLPVTPSSSPRSGAPKQPKTTQTGQDELEEGPVTGLIESQRRPRHLHNTDQYGRAAAVTTAGCVTAAASNSTICWSGAVSPALPAAINETGPASSWAEPRCSTTRLVRPSLATICTAVAPDAVLTLRKSGPTHRIPPRHQ